MKKLNRKDISYYTFQLIRRQVKWYLKRRLNINLIKNEAINDQGPFFITGNHVTAFDPIIALVYVKPLVKWVAADANLDNWIKRFFFKFARVIPIRKRYSDIFTIRRMIEEVKAGNSVGIYPEGGRCWHGETDELIKSTAKLIKLLGIRVYCQKLQGAYMSSPRWGKEIHKGRIDVSIYQILSDEEVKKLSEGEILDVLHRELYHNDFEYQRQALVKLTGKDFAEYIERLIYACPICGKFQQFASFGDEFKCKSCGTSGRVNNYGFIEGDFPYDNLVDWHHYQTEYLHRYLKESSYEPIKILDVNLKMVNEEGERMQRLVNLALLPNQIEVNDNNSVITISYKDITEASITFKNTLIFYDQKTRYEFLIEPFLHNNTSIVYIKEIINSLRGNQ